jgi:hypothetical protein
MSNRVNIDEFYIDDVLAQHAKDVKKNSKKNKKKGEDKKKGKKTDKDKNRSERVGAPERYENGDDVDQDAVDQKTAKLAKEIIKERRKEDGKSDHRERRENGTLVVRIS